MRFPALRRSLNASIRIWWASQQQDIDSWKDVEVEVRTRAAKRASRYGLSPDDGEDAASEAFARLLRLLQCRGTAGIRDFDPYVNCIIDNLCKGQIRRDKPVWTRLKVDIVETLRGRRGARGFAIWSYGSVGKPQREELAGYADWAGQPVSWNARYAELHTEMPALQGHLLSMGSPDEIPLPQLLSAIFNWVGTPLPVNDLTSLVFDLQRLQERECEPCSPDLVASPTIMMDEELLRAIAHAFRMLAPNDATAFLFHQTPEVAERLLMRIHPHATAESATCFLAERFAMSPAELADALEAIPWDDLRIARLLNIRRGNNHKTQQAIINLRQRAIRRMRQWVEKGEE